jgi:chloramphenicol O-acetyltransferase
VGGKLSMQKSGWRDSKMPIITFGKFSNVTDYVMMMMTTTTNEEI